MRSTIFLARVTIGVNCYKLVRFAHNFNKGITTAERAMLELLNLMKELEIVKFEEFSNAENERFKKKNSPEPSSK